MGPGNHGPAGWGAPGSPDRSVSGGSGSTDLPGPGKPGVDRQAHPILDCTGRAGDVRKSPRLRLQELSENPGHQPHGVGPVVQTGEESAAEDSSGNMVPGGTSYPGVQGAVPSFSEVPGGSPAADPGGLVRRHEGNGRGPDAGLPE